MMRPLSRSLIIWSLAFLVGLTFAASTANSRQINLGGHKGQAGEDHLGPNELPFKLPANTVQLPTLSAPVLNVGENRWRVLHVDAYLAPKDSSTAKVMEAMKKIIAAQAVRELPGNSFETMLSPYSGPKQARETIHAAAAKAIGRSWDGDVYIRSMTVY